MKNAKRQPRNNGMIHVPLMAALAVLACGLTVFALFWLVKWVIVHWLVCLIAALTFFILCGLAASGQKPGKTVNISVKM